MEFEAEEYSGKIKKVLPIVVILLVVAGAAYYFLTLPKAASLRVQVNEIDGKGVPSVEVTLEDNAGNQVGGSQITDAEGAAVFANAPAEVELVVRTQDFPGYDADSGAARISSGQDASVALRIARRSNVKLDLSGDTQSMLASITAQCTLPVTLQVSNAGENEFVAEIVAENGDAGVAASFENARTVGAQQAEEISGKLHVGSIAGETPESKSISLRLKGTKESVQLSFQARPAANVRVSPDQIQTGRDTQALLLSIRNEGRDTVSGVGHALQINDAATSGACGSDGARCVFVDWPKDASGASEVDTVFGGRELKVPIKITPPSESGKYLATIVVTGTCLGDPGITVPITMDVQ